MATIAKPLVQRVVLATDFSHRTVNAQVYAFAIASGFEASIVIVHAIEPILGTQGEDEPQGEFESFYDDLTDKAIGEMESIVEHARQQGIEASYHVEVGERWKVVLAIADRERADMIVLGRRSYKDNSRISLGTTSQRVYFGSQRPVLLVPFDESTEFE